jgi:ABC-type cobalamin/Fe3+-siderophores transport system ATPase subunit
MSLSLRLNDLTYSFDSHRVISYVNHTFLSGVTCITGPSGIGKSTLFHLISKKIFPSGGDILFSESSIYSLNGRVDFSQCVSFVTQEAFVSSYFSLDQYIAILGKKNDPVIKYYLDALGISGLRNSKISCCSGGERHRIAIFLALLKDVPLLLFDEPTAHLDEDNKAIFYRLVSKISQKIILIISHDKNNIQQYSFAEYSLTLKES